MSNQHSNNQIDISKELQNSNEGGSNPSQLKHIWGKLVEFFKSKGFLKIATGLAIAFLFYKTKGLYDNTIPISDALDLIQQKQFSRVVVGSLFLICYFKSPSTAAQFCIANRNLVGERKLNELLVTSGTKYQSPIIDETTFGYIIMAGFYGFILYKLYNNLRDMHGFKGKQKKDIGQQQKDRSFEDVGGCVAAKNAIHEIIDCIQRPELYKSAGVRMPKGVLLYGPPGTGKTLIAKAAATEAGIPVIYCSGSEFVEVFVGLGAKRIRDVFTQARAQAPCMIFIDEIDAVGFSRGNNNYIVGGGHREMETTLNELLNQMDGFEENDRILVVAATNLANSLDPALQRPGRFDQKIEIKLPNLQERADIFKIHLRNKSHQLNSKDLEQAALLSEGCSGAEIENMVNLVALQSVRKAQSLKLNHVKLGSEDFIGYIDGFVKDRRRMGSGMVNNAQPHHYYRQ